MTHLLRPGGRVLTDSAPALPLVGYATGSSGNSTTCSVDLSSLNFGSLQQDDVVVLMYGDCDQVAGDSAISCSGDNSGAYTELTELYSEDTFRSNFAAYYIVQGATVDTTATVTVVPTTGTPDSMGIIAMVFRGIDTTTPIDVTTTTATGIDTSLANPPSITPTTSGATVVACASTAHPRGTQTFTTTDLTDFVSIGVDVGSRDVTVGMGLSRDWTSGAVDPAAFGFTGTDATSQSWCACCIALRPA